MESSKAHAKGIIVRNYHDAYSNYRAEMSLKDFLVEQNVIGICDIDTRFLTKIVREEGSMMMIASTQISSKDEANKFKAQIEDTKSSLSIENKFDLGLDDILKDDLEASKNDNEVEKIKEKFAKVNEDKAQKSKDEKFSLKNSEEVK